MTSRHPYGQLVHADEIRVCIIEPGALNESIVCKLVHERLGSVPSYEAVSYTWGSPQIVGTIICDDLPMSVTDNLSKALLQFRSVTVPRTIWIDQICINQVDLDERSQQVRIMRDIYHRATRTLVWLGEAADGSDAAMDLIPRIVAIGSKIKADQSAFVTDWPNLGLPPITDPGWKAFGRLMKRKWFQRTWTLQEAAIASSAVVLCGTKELPWSMLEELISIPIRGLLTVPENLNPDPTMLDQPGATTAFGQVSVIKGLRKILLGTNPDATVDVLTLFCHGRRLRAKEPRDKVFALLRLTSPAFQRYISAPNYKRSVEDIYCEAAIKILITSDSLDFLCSAGCATQEYTLPSWVPDWWVPVNYPNFGRYGCFQACGGAEGRRGYADMNDDKVLTVKGKLLFAVTHVGNSFRSGEASFQYDELVDHFVPRMKKQNAEVQASLDVAAACKSYPTSQDTRTVFKQVITAGVRMQFSPENIGKPWVLSNATEAEFDFECYSKYMAVALNIQEYSEDHVPMEKETFKVAQRFLEAFDLATSRRVFGMAADGYMGLVPQGTKLGDRICLIFGCDVPFVLREHEKAWKLVGECYIHGIMAGEAFENDEYKVEEIQLI